MLPPFVGIAVNVTLSPEQIVIDEAEIDTDGVTEGVTLTVAQVWSVHPFASVTVTQY
ncbi:hypothetical protein HYS72_01925 [Candidatus Pacearchaeota archaeon]|nr:hypothetical protein [Candidatus Pacearchaeota archaeon]MBI2057099.1 hypothetical protein [Candidatus Pacearchaeota archaeon]